MSTAYPAIGASIILAGLDKLLGDKAYDGMFEQLGWSKDQMRRVAGAEVLGGLLMMLKPTRRLGGAIVAAASSTVLVAELRKNQVKLAASRGGVLIAALSAVALP